MVFSSFDSTINAGGNDALYQLEIVKNNSYITELEFQRESNLKMLQFDIDSFMQGYNSYIQVDSQNE